MTFIMLTSLTLATALAKALDAPLSARIMTSRDQPFLHEPFDVTLEIVSRDITVRQAIDLTDMPSSEHINWLSSFEPLPTQRETEGPVTIETRRYRARAQAQKSGPLVIAPSLHLITRQRTRSFFGNIWQEQTVSIKASPATLTIRDLPPPPDHFSGALGKALSVEITLSPHELAVGDLVTLSILLEGDGHMGDLRMPTIPDSLEGLKAYPLRRAESTANRHHYTQTLIPHASTVTAIPSILFSTFDTQAERYVIHEGGPWPLFFREAHTRVVTLFRPDEVAEDKAERTRQPPAWLRRGFLRHPPSETITTASTLRMAPSFESMPLATLPPGTRVRIREHWSDWLLVEGRRNRGWLHQAALNAGDPAPVTDNLDDTTP